MKNDLSFEVVVIGGGHAGCEAAAASARLGVNKSDLLKEDLNFEIKNYEHVLISVKNNLNVEGLILKIKNKFYYRIRKNA